MSKEAINFPTYQNDRKKSKFIDGFHKIQT